MPTNKRFLNSIEDKVREKRNMIAENTSSNETNSTVIIGWGQWDFFRALTAATTSVCSNGYKNTKKHW